LSSGCITGFRDIIRRLQGDLCDEFFHFPQGNTDSEWAFACFLEQLSKVRDDERQSDLNLKAKLAWYESHQITDPKARTICHKKLREAMLETVALLNKYTREAGIKEPSLMKWVPSGRHCVLIRLC
jgi:glutamine amidotransferase